MDYNIDFSQRKSALRYQIIGELVCGAVALMLVILLSVLQNKAIIPGVGILGFLIQCLKIFLVIMMMYMPIQHVNERKRIHRIFCPHCGKFYDYNNDVECDVVTINNSQLTKKQHAVIEFSCSCENCGQTTTFRKKFKTAEIDSFGNLKVEGIEHNMRKYFKL